MRDLGWPRLMLIGDRRLAGAEGLADAAIAAASRAPVLLQVREKDRSDSEILRVASRVRGALARKSPTHPVRVALNRRFDLALAAGVEGVHLPGDGPPPARVREAVGEDLFIGVSTHSPEEARRAAGDGADYVLFGPVFATPSKAGMGEPKGLARLAEAVRAAHPVPVLAVGGIDRSRLEDCLRAGAHGIAVIRAILAAADPRAAAREIQSGLQGATRGREA